MGVRWPKRHVLAPILVLAVCVPPTLCAEEEHAASVPFVQPQTVKAWVKEGTAVMFLDVREADEFAAAHIPGARNIPHDHVATIAAELPHDAPIVVYCIHSTHRAPEAAKTLRQLGFDNAYVMEGGLAAWEAGGQTILAEDPKQSPKILPFTERCANKPKPAS